MHSLIYLLQVSACTGIFYGCYYFLLRAFTFFTINRWYLLATLVASFIIPLITITVHKSAPVMIRQAVSINQDLPASFVSVSQAAVRTKSTVDLAQLIVIGYLIITAILLVRLIAMLGSLFYKLRGFSVNKIGLIKVIKGNNKLQNGSFLNYIFLNNEGLSATEAERILEHEMLHARFFHSADRILVKLAQIILWFNPFIYGYAYAIEENHEFEVDNEIGKRTDKGTYADMLLHLSINRQNIIFNSFSKAPLKRRITMLFTKPTYHMKKITYLLVLPVVIISCLAFARFKNEIQQQKYSAVDGVDRLKGNIRVLIDDKPYDADILYKISKSCIAFTSISNRRTETGNGKVKTIDPIVKVTTKRRKITYMTAIELDNLKKERNVDPTHFYTRLHLKENDGKPYDEIVINVQRGFLASTISPNGTAGFYVDKTYYTEEQAKAFSEDLIKSLGGEYSVGPVDNIDRDKGVDVMFHLKVKPKGVEIIHGKTKVEEKKPGKTSIR